MNQIALPFAWPAEEDERDFLLGEANSEVARHLEHWALWPVMATVLSGPRKSGRSLIGRIFAAKTRGELIDDAERRGEEDIFHAWNRAQAEHRPLLIIADEPPPTWRIHLADLRSRLNATPKVAITEPDDALAAALVEKLLGLRGLAVGRELISWLLPRIERSYVGIHRVVDALDEAALSRRARLTIPLARQELRRLCVIDDS